jgi:hypothetical protein
MRAASWIMRPNSVTALHSKVLLHNYLRCWSAIGMKLANLGGGNTALLVNQLLEENRCSTARVSHSSNS